MRTSWALVALAAMAGCLDAVETDHSLTATDVPELAAAGQPFTFPLEVRGPAGTSDHIGAHYWAQSTADPDADFAQQAGACQHTEGELPGTFDVTCDLEEGPVFLRGHLRTDAGDFWTQEYQIDVVDIDLRVENATSTASVGQRITFELHVEGDEAFTDHIGAHYWDEATEDPTGDFGAQAGACEHGEAELPTVFEVHCVWGEAGQYHVFGHVRLEGTDLWSQPFVVQVS